MDLGEKENLNFWKVLRLCKNKNEENYDYCIIGVSGGKNSIYQIVTAKISIPKRVEII